MRISPPPVLEIQLLSIFSWRPISYWVVDPEGLGHSAPSISPALAHLIYLSLRKATGYNKKS